MLNKSELKYLIDESLIEYAKEVLSELDETFKDFKEGDSISDLLEDNETLGTLTNDLEETIEAIENLENYELYTDEIEEIYTISKDLGFDRIEGKEDLVFTLNELIEAVRKIKI